MTNTEKIIPILKNIIAYCGGRTLFADEQIDTAASAIEKVHDEDRAALKHLIDGYCSEVELLDRDRHNLRMALLTLLRCFKNTTKTKEQERYCEAANNILQTTGRTRDILR